MTLCTSGISWWIITCSFGSECYKQRSSLKGFIKIQGGSFKDGFVTGALIAATSGITRWGDNLNFVEKLVLRAGLSGTSPVIGGGKFANRTQSAAFLTAMQELPQLYKKLVKYDLDMGPGGSAIGKGELQMPMAGVHDVFQVPLDTGLARNVLNIPSMTPATVFIYATALSLPLTNLNSDQIIGIATTYSRNKQRDRSRRLAYVMSF